MVAFSLLSLTVPMGQLPRTCGLGGLHTLGDWGWSLPDGACEVHSFPLGTLLGSFSLRTFSMMSPVL